MLKYLLILLLTIPCLASQEKEPKFHFEDCVKVKRGFYKDCYGKVEQFYYGSYTVDVDCKDTRFSFDFQEDNLQLAKGCTQ